jgi:aminomethyltransferase
MIDSIHPSAVLAGDGIPLHFGDQRQEYRAALEAAVLMDRSHEGRFEMRGRDRLEIPHRISTNDLTSLTAGEGRPTLFINANARILDRATFVHRGETALALTEPGRGEALRRYLQRNIFFNDEAAISDLNGTTRQYTLHGPQAEAIAGQFAPDLPLLHSAEVEIAGAPVLVLRDKPLSGSHWRLIVPNAAAGAVWGTLLDAGAGAGLIPAGSLTYNVLRIRAGRPGVGHELSAEYLPLEVGLWDEVSFTKGCYTGQEIIARMESRGRLAKTLVAVSLSAWAEAPAPLRADGREVGTLTSSAQSPDGELFGIGVVKVTAAIPGAEVVAGDGIPAKLTARIGAQPPYISEEAN